jgi:hypothetical protein
MLALRADAGERMRVTLQAVVFSIPCWDQRICLYEYGLYQQLNLPVFHGKGQKLTLLCRCKAGKEFTLEAKGSMLEYIDRENIGSGTDQVDGHTQFALELQVRKRF